VRSIRPIRSIRSAGTAPALRSLDPSAARWIGALIRISSPHPAMTRILDVIERLQDRPYRTNFLLAGEPGTGKDGLARALHQLMAPRGALVRLDVAGFPEQAADPGEAPGPPSLPMEGRFSSRRPRRFHRASRKRCSGC
jgi:transcriptional regulator of acetoin/glycerol metabolism